MKILFGLPALLLGTTLLAGSAFAQNNNNNNPSPPPPHFHWNHSGNGQGNGQAGPPPAPQNGHPHFSGNRNPGNHQNFAGNHANNNQAHWNHALNFHDRNVVHFNAQDRSIWTHGQWRHTRHNGHDGWWWYAGGAWFFYDQPTYPYPGYVSDDYDIGDQDEDAGVQPGQDPYSWYYCNNPPGYYPYIQSCRGPWQPVQPTAPQGYDQGPQQGAPDADDDDDRGPPPGWQQQQGQFQGQPNGPQQGYDDDSDDDDQGPPPPGYNGDDRGPPPGYSDQGPR